LVIGVINNYINILFLAIVNQNILNSITGKIIKIVSGKKGVEPMTFGFENHCSTD
jgi:hypothetical protein